VTRRSLVLLPVLAVAAGSLAGACASTGSSSAADGGGVTDASVVDAANAGDAAPLDATGNGDAPVDSAAVTPGDSGVDAPSCGATGTFGSGHGAAFSYGRHYPNGASAVAYAYGAGDLWGDMTGLQYVDNYYAACGTTDHPTNTSALIAAADGPPFTTRDANCHLLWGADPGSSDPALGVPDSGAGSAFHEHAGVGAGGVQSGAPFTVYWYDDNTLATVMSQAYGLPAPGGLVVYPDFTRWAVLSGNAAAWHGMPYGASGNPTSDCCIDTKALNGLYDLASGDFASAASEWMSLLAMTGSTYDAATQRYLYPSITSNYHLGLFKILTDELRASSSASASSTPSTTELLQHSLSLDSDILDNQQQQGDSGVPIGWVTDIPAGGSLINIETVACDVLGLGARSSSVFEPGVAPLSSDPGGYFLRPYHVLSAVGSAGSKPGYMTLGPGFQASPGAYTVDFRLRAPSPTGTVATLSIYDDVTSAVLATHDVAAADLATGNEWTEISVPVTVSAPCTRIELRTYWTGTGNLDVGPIRVR
jgi:hypothetical protein